jgi:hypothetical protein
MRGAIPPLPRYAFTGWCSVKPQGQLYLYLTFCGFLSPRNSASSGGGGRGQGGDGLQKWTVAAKLLNKQQRTVDKACSSTLGVRGQANNSP